jgi:alpha-beta hydrolase superfamily lysophospholipase
MESSKATAITEWAKAQGLGCLCFDYSGHGRSQGSLLEESVGDWLEESAAMFELIDAPRVVLVGSSMGGWIALLLARQLRRQGKADRLAGLVLTAPAFDMTETLMWQRLPEEARQTIERDGVYYQPSASGELYPITRRLVEEGRAHLLAGQHLELGVPVHILQGMRDPNVPWGHALVLADLLEDSDVTVTLIKNAEHRLSRPEDFRRLENAMALVVARAEAAGGKR